MFDVRSQVKQRVVVSSSKRSEFSLSEELSQILLIPSLIFSKGPLGNLLGWSVQFYDFC